MNELENKKFIMLKFFKISDQPQKFEPTQHRPHDKAHKEHTEIRPTHYCTMN